MLTIAKPNVPLEKSDRMSLQIKDTLLSICLGWSLLIAVGTLIFLASPNIELQPPWPAVWVLFLPSICAVALSLVPHNDRPLKLANFIHFTAGICTLTFSIRTYLEPAVQRPGCYLNQKRVFEQAWNFDLSFAEFILPQWHFTPTLLPVAFAVLSVGTVHFSILIFQHWPRIKINFRFAPSHSRNGIL